MKAIWRELMFRLIHKAWRVVPHLVLILKAQIPVLAQPVVSAGPWRQRKIARIANLKRIVNLRHANQQSAKGPKSSTRKIVDIRSVKIVALWRTLESAKF